MKNIVRILSLTAALGFAAIPAAPFQILGPCYYTCCSTNPNQCRTNETYTSESECCNPEGTVCPAGQTLRGISWGDPKQRCSI